MQIVTTIARVSAMDAPMQLSVQFMYTPAILPDLAAEIITTGERDNETLTIIHLNGVPISTSLAILPELLIERIYQFVDRAKHTPITEEIITTTIADPNE